MYAGVLVSRHCSRDSWIQTKCHIALKVYIKFRTTRATMRSSQALGTPITVDTTDKYLHCTEWVHRYQNVYNTYVDDITLCQVWHLYACPTFNGYFKFKTIGTLRRSEPFTSFAASKIRLCICIYFAYIHRSSRKSRRSPVTAVASPPRPIHRSGYC
jgi:hypothetical protein